MSQKLALLLAAALLAGGCTQKNETPVAAASTVPSATPAAQIATGPLTRVPDVTSAPHFVSDGILAVQKKGFTVAVVQREDPDNRPGYIIDQAPDGLSSRPEGSVIRLTVATRRKVDLTLPEGEAKSLTAATAEKMRRKFAGDHTVTVPPVEGKRAIDALLALQQRGLKVNLDTVGPMAGFRTLTVGSQDRAAGDAVPPGTSVEIKCVGRELDATPEEIARLTRENQTLLRHTQERLEAIRTTNGRG